MKLLCAVGMTLHMLNFQTAWGSANVTNTATSRMETMSELSPSNISTDLASNGRRLMQTNCPTIGTLAVTRLQLPANTHLCG